MTDTGIPAGDRLGRARQCVIGCFAGQAIGGSVGAGVQFLSQAAFAERYGQEWPDGYPTAFGGTGLITAETQLALFTLDGMVRAHVRRRVTGETDPLPEVRLALTRWLRSQKPDAAAPSGWLPGRPQLHARRWPDTTTVSVLESGHFGTLEEPVNDSAEAGVLPRAAAAALWSADERVVFELGARIAALTHGHPTAYLSAGAYAVIINRLVRGIGNPVRAVAAAQAVLASWAGHEPVTAALEAALAPYYEGEGTSVTAAEVARLGTGQTAAEALAMAVCAGLSSPRFEHAIASATGHGGNTTTVGALTGGLFGTLFDFTSVIQVPLLRDLELGEEIATLGDAAVKEFGPTPPTAPSWREHFPFQD